MGTMSFLIPEGNSPETSANLLRAFLAGGPDHSPTFTETSLTAGRLYLHKDRDDESGYVVVPWEVVGAGCLLTGSTTLMERQEPPYRLLVELARGKVNQLRNQTFEWEWSGLELPDAVRRLIAESTRALKNAVIENETSLSDSFARQSLTYAFQGADQLVQQYIRQIFGVRHERFPKLDSVLSCRLADVPSEPIADAYRQAFNTVCVPMTWRGIEQIEAKYDWSAVDRVVEWAEKAQLKVVAGPLIDFSKFGQPEWLSAWENDLPSLASFMCDYIETAITRYRGRIKRWLISSGSNCAFSIHADEEDLLRLTARLLQAAWNIDNELEVLIGLAQPWGDYLNSRHYEHSPYVFADHLLRAGLPLSAIELEWHMGTSPRGTPCRDRLEASRHLDMMASLMVPLQVSMSYPSAATKDPAADAEQRVADAGYYREISQLGQAEWADDFASLAVCKPYIVGAYWDHLRDDEPHRYPHGGLVDAAGNVKPAFERLRWLREAHLRSGVDRMLTPEGG